MLLQNKKKYKILFRLDANNEIGMGHVTRCTFLANELSTLGHEIHFMTSTNIKKFLNNYGTCHTSKNIEENELKIIKKIKPDIFILDILEKFFPFSNSYFTELRKSCDRLIAIDFVSENLKFFDKSFHSLFGPRKFSAKKTNHSLKYAIVKNQFQNVSHSYQIKKDVSSILIIQGGSDTECIAPKILSSLKELQSNIEITMIIGPNFKCWDKLRTAQKLSNHKLKILHDVKNIENVMKQHQLAITAAGVSMTELLTIGIPSIIVYGNSHEKEAAELIHNNQLGINIGLGTKISKKKILESVNELLVDFKKRKILHKNNAKIFDGKGANRILNDILCN